MLLESRRNRLRLIGLFIIILSLLPLASAGVSSLSEDSRDTNELRASAEQVTFVSTQGGSTDLYEHAGKLVAVHTPTKQRIWTHDTYRRYMDIDPLDENRILFVAGERTSSGDFQRVAVVINWRTGEELQKFPVPWDTHDIDAVGENRFAVADKSNHTAYIIDSSTDEVTWRYDFRNHFDSSSDGDDPVDGDWTHLNDIDLYNDGEHILLSPRDFDRVILINRSTKETIWTLGSEDAHNVLYEQHNPVLLDRSPPTVLIADSENNRIVEYRRQDDSWQQIWRYEGDLNWPRDADRLPNGNTLISDTANDRVIEVNSDGKTVWEYHVSRSPYDMERLQYGDEPAGPPMTAETPPSVVGPIQGQSLTDKILAPYFESFSKAYQLIGAWVVPSWAGPLSFLSLCFGVIVALGWLGIELMTRVPIVPAMDNTSSPSTQKTLIGSIMILIGILALPLLITFTNYTATFTTLSFVLFALGLRFVAQTVNSKWSTAVHRILFSTKLLTLAMGAVLCLVLLANALLEFQSGPSHMHILNAIVVFTVIMLLRESHPRLLTTEWVRFKRN